MGGGAPGFFITLEGPDGSGKSSQIPALADFLRQAGLELYVTREPGGTPIGDQVRAVIMNLENKAMRERTEILLFQASRAQLVAEVIRPQLAAGVSVLCDRYADSTLAYQGYGHQVDMPALRQVVNFATAGLTPDLTLLLDIDARLGLQRRSKGGGEWNRMDDYALAFHERVRQGYLEMARLEPQRWAVIDADQPPAAVQAALRRAAAERLGLPLPAG